MRNLLRARAHAQSPQGGEHPSSCRNHWRAEAPFETPGNASQTVRGALTLGNIFSWNAGVHNLSWAGYDTTTFDFGSRPDRASCWTVPHPTPLGPGGLVRVGAMRMKRKKTGAAAEAAHYHSMVPGIAKALGWEERLSDAVECIQSMHLRSARCAANDKFLMRHLFGLKMPSERGCRRRLGLALLKPAACAGPPAGAGRQAEGRARRGAGRQRGPTGPRQQHPQPRYPPCPPLSLTQISLYPVSLSLSLSLSFSFPPLPLSLPLHLPMGYLYF